MVSIMDKKTRREKPYSDNLTMISSKFSASQATADDVIQRSLWASILKIARGSLPLPALLPKLPNL
jgi:hypothetical protein